MIAFAAVIGLNAVSLLAQIDPGTSSGFIFLIGVVLGAWAVGAWD